MKILVDFFPIMLFFVVYIAYDDEREGILAATAAVIIGTIIQVAYTYFKERKVQRMHLVVLGSVVVLGGLTLILQDEMFIKWKPTVVNWLFAVGFLVYTLVTGRVVIERMIGKELELPDKVWRTLNWAWIGFFAFLGLINVIVVYNFSTDFWVNFKLFGQMALTFVFFAAQGLYLYSTGNLEAPEEETAADRNDSSAD